MHKRQSGNANLIIIIVLVVLAVIGAGLFLWSRQDDKNDNADTESDSTTITTPIIAEKEEDTTETILDVELLLQRSGYEDLLPAETPATFKEYIAARLNDFDCDFVESPSGGYTITKISPRFVAGGIGCLGGAATVWYLTTAGWEELGFQSYVPCTTLVEFAIPSEFLNDCYDDSSPGEEIIPNPNGPLN
ncbi:MAG: hypothetical protein AAB624_01010 [Patescibacteria group bacterium]